MKKPKHLLEVKIAIASKGDRRMSIGRQSGRRKGDIEKITIQEEEGKEQEVAVGHETAPPKKKASSAASLRELTVSKSKISLGPNFPSG